MPTRFSTFARPAFALLLSAGLWQGGQAQAAPFRPGSRVEGHVGSHWAPCMVVGDQLPTGGYRLHCDSLPDPEYVFSETDVREIGAGQPAAVNPAPVAAQGRPVQGRVAGAWVSCATIGAQLPTGGYRLHCDSLPDPEYVFSETDVREIGAAQPAPINQPAAPPQGRRVQGRVAGAWEGCVMIGGQLPTGGYLLRCDSNPNMESVFSATDVRF